MSNKVLQKILIIEDDPGILNYLKTTVDAAGYETVTATDGNLALHMITSHCPDCILLDLGLPDMDGSDIITSVRKWTLTPIIVISARDSEENKANALDSGADDYITKPFGSIELLARIRTALRHSLTAAENKEIGIDGCYHVG